MLKYFWSGKPVTFYATLVATLGLFLVLGHFSKIEFSSCQIEFELEAEKPVNFALYYDVGRGFNEVDHQSVMIETVGEETKVSFCIPILNELRRIRFDPGEEHTRMKISSITISYENNTVFEVPLDTIAPEHDILEYGFDGKRFAFETNPGGNDPMFVLNQIGPARSGSRLKDPLHYAFWMLAGLCSLLLGGFMHRYFFMGR